MPAAAGTATALVTPGTVIARRGSPPPSTATVTDSCLATAGVHALAASRSSARTQNTPWISAAALTWAAATGSSNAACTSHTPSTSDGRKALCSQRIRPACASACRAGVARGATRYTSAPASSSAGTRRVATVPAPTTSTRGPAQCQCPGHDRGLVFEHRVVDAGTPAGHPIGCRPGERRDQRGGRRGVGDPHVTRDEDPRAVVDQLLRDPDPGLDRRAGFVARQGRLDRQVPGPAPDVGGHQPGYGRQRARHGYIDDGHC